MIKLKLILAIAMILISVNLVSAGTVYQENSDSFTNTSNWWSWAGIWEPVYLWDGVWTTATAGNGNAYYWPNYTHAPDAASAIWSIKIGSGAGQIYNYSVPSSCWTQDPLQFQVYSKYDAAPYRGSGSCWNGSSWEVIYQNNTGQCNGDGVDDTCAFIFEEAVYWNVSGSVFVGNGTIYDDGCNNYTANRDFYVDTLNVSTCEFYIDSSPFCYYEDKDYFDTSRICEDIELIIPLNGTNVTNGTLNNFTANFTDGDGIYNVTLHIYNETGGLVHQITTFVGGALQATIGTVVALTEGVYTWFYSMFDMNGQEFFSDENFTITVLSEEIDQCGGITVPGTYYLNDTVVASEFECIEIRTDNVTLDCNNNVIDGNFVAGVGVSIDGYDNIHIVNCEVRNLIASWGLIVNNSAYSTYENFTLTNNSNLGIFNSNYNNFTNFTMTGSSDVFLDNSSNNLMSEFYIHDDVNDYCINFDYSDYNKFTNSYIQCNSILTIVESNDHTYFYNNILNMSSYEPIVYIDKAWDQDTFWNNNYVVSEPHINISQIYDSTTYTQTGSSSYMPIIVGEYLYFGNTNGTFYKMDTTGISNSPQSISISPGDAVHGGIFYASDENALYLTGRSIGGAEEGALYKIDLNTFTLVMNRTYPGYPSLSIPIVDNDYIYIGSYVANFSSPTPTDNNRIMKLNKTTFAVEDFLDIDYRIGTTLIEEGGFLYSAGYASMGTYNATMLEKINKTTMNIVASYNETPLQDFFLPIQRYGSDILFASSRDGEIWKMNKTDLSLIAKETNPQGSYGLAIEGTVGYTWVNNSVIVKYDLDNFPTVLDSYDYEPIVGAGAGYYPYYPPVIGGNTLYGVGWTLTAGGDEVVSINKNNLSQYYDTENIGGPGTISNLPSLYNGYLFIIDNNGNVNQLGTAMPPVQENVWFDVGPYTSTNIMGNLLTGGNYWTNPSGTGFSDTCIDSDWDGICENPYIFTNLIDTTSDGSDVTVNSSSGTWVGGQGWENAIDGNWNTYAQSITSASYQASWTILARNATLSYKDGDGQGNQSIPLECLSENANFDKTLDINFTISGGATTWRCIDYEGNPVTMFTSGTSNSVYEMEVIFDKKFADYYPLSKSINITVNVTLIDPPTNSSFDQNETPISFYANHTIVGTNNASFLNLTNTTLTIWAPDGSVASTTTVSISGLYDTTNLTPVFPLSVGTYQWNYYSCGQGSVGTECSWAPTNFTFDIDFITYQVVPNPTWETKYEEFSTTIGLPGGSMIIAATLLYNGSAYFGSIVNQGTNYTATVNIDIPPITSDTYQERTFHWEIVVSDINGVTEYNLTPQAHNVTPARVGVCGAGITNQQVINFTFRDEETNQTILVDDVGLDSKYYIGQGSHYRNFSVDYTNVSSFELCMNNINQTIKFFPTIELEKSGYETRTFDIFNIPLTNGTMHNRVLYLANTTRVSDVEITILDSGLSPMRGVEVRVYRDDIGTGEEILVENKETDNLGIIVTKLVLNDVKYIVRVYDDDGDLLGEKTFAYISCQPGEKCKLEVVLSELDDYDAYRDANKKISGVLSYNELGNYFTFTIVDTSEFSSNYTMVIKKTNATINNREICRNSTVTQGFTNISNTVICDLDDFGPGTYTGQVFRYYIDRDNDNNIPAGTTIRIEAGVGGALTITVDDGGHNLASLEALLWSLIVGMTLLAIGAWSPLAAVILYATSMLVFLMSGLVAGGTVVFIAITTIALIFAWAINRR